jgi:hypothetical protein
MSPHLNHSQTKMEKFPWRVKGRCIPDIDFKSVKGEMAEEGSISPHPRMSEISLLLNTAMEQLTLLKVQYESVG